MNLFALTTLSCGIASIILSVIAFCFGKTRLHRQLFFFNAMVAVWGMGLFFAGIAQSEDLALASWKIATMGGILIGPAFYHLISILCGTSRKSLQYFGYIQGAILAVATVGTDLVINSTRYVYGLHYIVATYPFTFLLGIYALFVGLSFLKLFRHMYELTGYKRLQAQYIAGGFSIGFFGATTAFLPAYSIDVMYPFGNFGITIYCMIVTYSIIRHRIMDIRIVVKKSLVYSLSVSLITALYIVLVLLATKYLSHLTHISSLSITAASALIIALLFTPLKNRVQLFIEKLFYKSTPDYYKIIQNTSHKLASSIQLDQIYQILVDSIQNTLNLKTAYLLAAREECFEPVYFRLANNKSVERENAPGHSSESDVKENLTDNNKKKRLSRSGQLLKLLKCNYMITKDEVIGLYNDERKEQIKEEFELFNGEVAVQMHVDGKMAYVLVLGGSLSEDPLSDKEITMVKTLVSQASLALKNGKLYEELDRRVEKRTEELSLANDNLNIEIAERKVIENELQSIQKELEHRVDERTSDLKKVNEKLETEILDRRRAEEHMIKAYQLSHKILEKSPIGIYMVDNNGSVEYVNKAMLDINGETHKQFAGNSIFELGSYADLGLDEKIKNTLKGTPFVMGPLEYRSEFGKRTRIAKIHGFPVSEEDDKKALIFFEDLTELHTIREELFLARNDWEETFNTITDIITVHDRDFNIIGANDAAKLLLNLPELEMNKKIKCYEKYHGTDSPPDGCPGCDCLKSNEPGIYEVYEPHLNAYIEIRSIPRFDNNDRFSGVIHICRDITKRKENEALIQTSMNRLNALRSIDKAIIGSIDLNMTLDIFLHQVTSELKVDAASVLLLNKKNQMMKYVSSKGFRSNALKHTLLRLGDGLAGRAAVERRIIEVQNLKEIPDPFVRSKEFEQEGFVSYFAVPLIAKGDVKGVLELFHRSEMMASADWLEFLESITDQGAIAIDNSTMFNDLERTNIDLSLAYDKTIEGWSRAMDMRDKETEGHSQRVTELTIRIAQELGIDDKSLVHIRRGALLHDMGKLGIPDSILLKPGKLTEEEWVIMKKHPEFAYEMLHPIEHLRSALDIPYYHHEKWDGTGYPKGLSGEDIPVSARIFAIVDVWDALCSDRPYRPGWPKEKVMDHIRSLSGSHFDAEIVEIFFKIEWEVRSGELTISS